MHEHEMVDGLDDQPHHATDDEQPENIEIVEGNVALATLIAPEHILTDGLGVGIMVVHTLEMPLQLAFLEQRRIKRD